MGLGAIAGSIGGFRIFGQNLDATAATVKNTMEAAARLSVPLIVDTGRGRTWAEAH